MFLCQGKSRNQMNSRAAFGDYLKENFCRLSRQMQWAHFDTIDVVLNTITMEGLEEVKTLMIKELVRKKRILTTEGCYTVVVDGTGVTTYDEDPGGSCCTARAVEGASSI